MKKYIPATLFTFALLTYLIGQVIFNGADSTAKPSEQQKKQYMHYEDVLKKTSFTDLEGAVFKDLNKKHKVVIINFWASWCLPCLEELPSMVELRKKYSKEDLLILTINTDEKDDFKEVKKLMKKFNTNFPVVRDYKGDHVKSFLIEAIPVTIVFSKGKVVQISMEAVDFVSGEFLQKINSLIKS
jgi:thiol-disulfide isomerase/thioredoxin